MVARTFIFPVTAPATTVAAQAAQALAERFPSAPAWSSELSTPVTLGGGQINALVPARGASGPSSYRAFNAPNAPSGTITLLYWTGKAQWYSGNGGEWYFVAGTTGAWPGSQTVVKYSVTSDRFSHYQGDSYTDEAGDRFDGYGCAHNFDNSCGDPATGKLYRFVPYQRVGGVTNANNWTLAEWNAATSTGRAIPSTNGYGADDFRSTEFYPDLGKVFVRRGNGTSVAWTTYAPATNTWGAVANSQSWASPSQCYHNGYIYIADGLNFWRFDGTTATSRAACPVTIYGGTDVGTHGILVSLGAYIYAFVNRTVYRYDPSTNAWSGVYDTYPWASSGEDNHFTVGPLRLASGDVALFVRSINDFSHEALLWKP